jgi:hypothetical protein
MKTIYLGLLAAGAGLCLAQGVSAATKGSPSDVKYCHALASKYSAGHPIMQSPNVAVDEAALGCDNDTATSIATLTKAMKDEKINLPPRG